MVLTEKAIHNVMKINKRIERDAVLIGRIIIPNNATRDDYVNYCLQNHVVGVLMPNGDFLRECPIASPYIGYNDGLVSAMDFPKDKETLGSSVVLVTTPQTSQAIVIGCITPKNPTFPIQEGCMSLKKCSKVDDGDSYAEVNIKGGEGTLNLSANSGGSGGGKVRVNARNGGDTGEIELKSDVFNKYVTNDESLENKGNVTRLIKKTLEETIEEAFNMTVSNASTWEFEDDLTIHSQSTAKFDADTEVLLGSSGHQPVLLGNDTVDRLDDIVGLIGDLAQALLSFSSTNAAIGAPVASSPATIASATQIQVQAQALSAQLTLLKSQKVKTE